jgi:hypothetical protein
VVAGNRSFLRNVTVSIQGVEEAVVRYVLAAVVLGVSAFTAGCGDPVVKVPGDIRGESVADPYDGPLHLPSVNPTHKDPLVRSGAAGRALECTGDVYQGGYGKRTGVSGRYRSPMEALRILSANWDMLPSSGYRVEREDGERILYSYDVAGKTRIAVIVVKDDARWRVEAAARCDPAELSDSATDEMGVGVWTDQNGDRVPVAELSSRQGPAHCNWESITFLITKDERYFRDPDGVLRGWRTIERQFDSNAVLPLNATDTGYTMDGQRLWFAADKSAAFVVSGEKVERWPAFPEGSGCV